MQSSGFVYMSFTLPILSLEKWQCYSEVDLYSMGPERRTLEWQLRVRYIQGAIISVGVVQMLLGYSGKLIIISQYACIVCTVAKCIFI